MPGRSDRGPPGRMHSSAVCYQRSGLAGGRARPAAAATADGRPWLADAGGGGTDAEAPTNGRQSPSVPRRTDHITRLSSHGGVARGGGKRALPSTRPRAAPAVVSAAARVSQGERCLAASSNIRPAFVLWWRDIAVPWLGQTHGTAAAMPRPNEPATAAAACCYRCSHGSER